MCVQVRGADVGGLEAGIIQNLSKADTAPVTSNSTVSVKGQVVTCNIQPGVATKPITKT